MELNGGSEIGNDNFEHEWDAGGDVLKLTFYCIKETNVHYTPSRPPIVGGA